ncbi:hypothetical protein GGS21DRAFT_153616 [Xylaria nigripes]|nr:hypothetical protein GGS21DRAFT_153616 [Xylaria nigripes]
MASEEPQKLPVSAQVADPAPADKMEVDESSVKPLDADTKADAGLSQLDEVPITNGDTQKPTAVADDEAKSSQNQQAFATNKQLQDSSPSKETTETKPTNDTDVAEANGASEVEKKPSSEKPIDNVDLPAPSTKEPDEHDETVVEAAGPVGESAEESKAAPEESGVTAATLDTGAESMDVDDATGRLDLPPSTEQVDKTLETSAVKDTAAVSSPNEPAQKLSKLDIKATQQEEDISPTQADISMAEVAASSIKIPRERDEDDADEPLAKRAKTADADESMVDSPAMAKEPGADTPTREAASGALDSAIPDDLPITPYQNKKTREVLGNVKKTKTGGNFRKSVQELWPGLWNDYKAKIDNPIDISLIESKLREDKYANYGQFKADVKQLYENAVLFNGPNHEVSRAAAQVRDYILVRMPEIIHTKTPVKPEKGKAQPTRYTEPRAATQPRRPSHSQPQAPATTTKSKTEQSPGSVPGSATAQAFAIPPSGIPQIRRDSTRDDHDRPKRPIHPPKNRDPEYSSKASRKKKLDPEQRFIEVVLDEVKKLKYYAINQWFLAPVDPVALNIPNYFKVIKKPMDLATMTEKNYDGEYKTTKDLEKDMKLIVHNSEIFNGADHEVTSQARQLEELVKSQLSGKDKWMERHIPSVAPMHTSATSPQRSMGESDDESDVEGEEEDSDAIQNLQQRLNEEQEKLNQLLNSKKPDLMMMEVQQSMVTMLQRKLVEERTKFHNEKRPKKKKASNAKSKSKAGGGSSLGGNKKMAGSAHTSKKLAGGGGGGSSKKTALPKKRPIGALEKAVIAEGINELDGNTLIKAVEIIKRDTGQNENDDGEMELDIDSLTLDALTKLYDLINKAHPHIRQGLAKKPEYSNAVSSEPEPKAKPGGLPKAKKNKPMNKHEQERKIEQLRELKAQLQRHGSGSQEPPPGEVEQPAPADSSESSDSEEE